MIHQARDRWPQASVSMDRSGPSGVSRSRVTRSQPAGWLEALLRYGGILVVLLGLALVATAVAVATGRGRRSTTSA